MPPPTDAELIRAVALRIRELRERRGITQATVAEKIATAEQNYRRIESGRQNLTLETIWRIADALGVSAWELLVPPGSP